MLDDLRAQLPKERQWCYKIITIWNFFYHILGVHFGVLVCSPFEYFVTAPQEFTN